MSLSCMIEEEVWQKSVHTLICSCGLQGFDPAHPTKALPWPLPATTLQVITFHGKEPVTTTNAFKHVIQQTGFWDHRLQPSQQQAECVNKNCAVHCFHLVSMITAQALTTQAFHCEKLVACVLYVPMCAMLCQPPVLLYLLWTFCSWDGSQAH